MIKPMQDLTHGWGSAAAVSLYLDRCQVDTPYALVDRVWALVMQRRRRIGSVLDLGAGDGRFARGASFASYIGVEIDASRTNKSVLPKNARMIYQCAFETPLPAADVCIGNPPYVRNQDLPQGWRQKAETVIAEKTNVQVSGLANAWQYFTFLALACTKGDGVAALVIPYEWVSRPSAAALRSYIKAQRWEVDCYRLLDETFDHVLTTCSITIINKRKKTGKWSYYQEVEGNSGTFTKLTTPSGKRKVVNYRRPDRTGDTPVAKRGLSPGTQEWLVLTEGTRARYGLKPGRDVVRCITSLKLLPSHYAALTNERFHDAYINTGARCWLIRTDRDPSDALDGYLGTVPKSGRDNATCNARDEWWKFKMPMPPKVIVSSGFRGNAPKVVVNEAGVVAVGALSGIHNVSPTGAKAIARKLRSLDLTNRVVPHSNGLRKLEVGQLQALLEEIVNAENRSA